MSDLKTRIADDTKIAMKARDAERVAVLRMLGAELKQREVVEAVELTDAVVSSAVEKMVKQRRDAEKQYRDGGRPELADKEAAEIAILLSYLPQQLEEAEILKLIEAAIAATGASGAKDMGKVVGQLRPQVQGRADMAAVSALIKSRLSA